MKKIISILTVIAMVICMLPAMAFANDEIPAISITVDGVAYDNVTTGTEIIIGDKDINDVDIRIVSYKGYTYENVGTKSGVLDNQGRTVLEFSPQSTGNGIWSTRICYHAEDDPVEANRSHPFEIPEVIFKTDENASAAKITSPAVKGLKAAAQTKAAKITWSKSKCTGYKIQYSTKSSFSGAKTITVKGKYAYTIKNLKSGKKYYVRVRSYKTYQDELGNTKTVKSSWKTTTVKVK